MFKGKDLSESALGSFGLSGTEILELCKAGKLRPFSTTLLVGAIAYFREVTYDLPKKFVKNRSAKGGHTSSSPWGENLALERGTQCFDPVPGLVAIVQAYRCRNFDAKSNNNEQA